MRGLFVVGTDTGVGKTQIASAIVRTLKAEGHRVGVLKPVATGVVTRQGAPWIEDAESLRNACGLDLPIAAVCPIVYAEPLAPPVAARRAGEPLRFDRLLGLTLEAIDNWTNQHHIDIMVVEGVGGLLCPIAEGATVADLAVRLDYPIVIVARRGLGTLNHTLLTVEAARLRGLRVAGVVLNVAETGQGAGVAAETNPDELARWLGLIPILANVSYIESDSAAPLLIDGVDWYTRSNKPRLPSPRA